MKHPTSKSILSFQTLILLNLLKITKSKQMSRDKANLQTNFPFSTVKFYFSSICHTEWSWIVEKLLLETALLWNNVNTTENSFSQFVVGRFYFSLRSIITIVSGCLALLKAPDFLIQLTVCKQPKIEEEKTGNTLYRKRAAWRAHQVKIAIGSISFSGYIYWTSKRNQCDRRHYSNIGDKKSLCARSRFSFFSLRFQNISLRCTKHFECVCVFLASHSVSSCVFLRLSSHV